MNLTAAANHLWQSTLFTIFAWLLVQAIRRNSARVRYTIWMLASVKFLIPLSLLIGLGAQVPWPTPASNPPVRVAPVIEFIGQPFQPISMAVQPAVEPSPMTASPPRPSVVPQVLVTIWLVGAVAVTAVGLVRLRRVKKILSAARRLTEGPELEALDRARDREGWRRSILCATTKSVIEPGVHGVFRHVLLLPAKVAERLSVDQLDAIIAHEICHIRWYDNLLGLVHMAVEAIFWFHPLVWWIGAQLVTERERACDEHVLARGGDPTVYASAILKVCEFYVALPVACVAGVSGSDLKSRIVLIMKNKGVLKLTFARKALIAAAAAFAVGMPILIGSTQATGSQSGGTPSTFEVADVHPSANTTILSVGGVLRGSRYEIRTATMVDLIKVAYGIDEDDQVVGGPSWLANDRFDIIAKTPAGTTPEAIKKMLQTLLADRFKLAIHNDTRPINAYALTAGNRIKMKGAGAGGSGDCRIEPERTETDVVPHQLVSCTNVTMNQLARRLKGMGAYNFIQPVVDQTNLQGAWDFDFKFTMRAQLAAAGGDGISLYDAMDKQLGLKLQPKKIAMPVIVVDRVNEKPTENLPGVANAIPPVPEEFETGVIKPTDPNSPDPPRVSFQASGRLDIHAMTARDLITLAWDIPPDMLVGAPKWLDTNRFDVVAKAPAPPTVPGSPPAAAPISIDTLRTMLRALIVEQFKLVTHRENQTVNVYAFIVPANGVTKLQKADPSNRSECKHTSGVSPNPALSSSWTCTNTTTTQLAAVIRGWAPQYVDHPAVDLTGLTDPWDFTVSWTPKPALIGAPGSDPNGGLSMFEAVERQLGLKLIPQKHPMPVLVIDHVNEKPGG